MQNHYRVIKRSSYYYYLNLQKQKQTLVKLFYMFSLILIWFFIFDFCLIRNYFFRTWLPSYVQLPNFISQCWSSKGNQVMSILHVLLKMPGGTYRQLPLCLTTTLVWYVPSNPSSALNSINTYFSLFFVWLLFKFCSNFDYFLIIVSFKYLIKKFTKKHNFYKFIFLIIFDFIICLLDCWTVELICINLRQWHIRIESKIALFVSLMKSVTQIL